MEQELLLELLISLVCRKRVRVVLVLQTIHVRLDILSKHKKYGTRFILFYGKIHDKAGATPSCSAPL